MRRWSLFKIFHLFFFSCFCAGAPAAEPLWTWVKGSDQPDKPGVYGTKGTPDPANTPGARAGASAWSDAAGRLWLFGGSVLPFDAGCNDLWHFDPASGNWTWLKGSSQTNQSGVYGTRGSAAPANTPGARNSAATWTDSSGHLWLFGGYGLDAAGGWGNLGDLWRFDPASGNWTWVKGSDMADIYGVYGALGKAAPANTPGGRGQAVAWGDRAGRLWLFGGIGWDGMGNLGQLNDLWCFDPASGNWTWIKGSNHIRQAGVYGTRGVAAPANTPGARRSSSAWTDRAGRFWLFGGEGSEAGTPAGFRNDLWRFDPASGNWTWLKGSQAGNQAGVYGTLGVDAPANTPGARWQAAAWTDPDGRLWLMGGDGRDSKYSEGRLNDLWCFDPFTGNWAWHKGSNLLFPPDVYGTLGVADPANTPGARFAASAAGSSGGAGRLWFFGGMRSADYYSHNDLWLLTIPKNAATPAAWRGLE